MTVKVGKLYNLREVRRLTVVEKLSANLWRPKDIVRVSDLSGISLYHLDSVVLVVDIARLNTQLATWQEITDGSCHRTRIPIVLWKTWYFAVDFKYLVPVKL